MKRRDFMRALGGVASWLLAARAQQPGAPPRVGLLLANPMAGSADLIEAFRQGLKEQRLQPDRDIVLILGGSVRTAT